MMRFQASSHNSPLSSPADTYSKILNLRLPSLLGRAGGKAIFSSTPPEAYQCPYSLPTHQHLTPNTHHPILLHTAGSVPMSVFPSNIQSPPRGLGGLCYGVLYPMQTFSKDRSVNFREIPCFVEASDSNTLEEIKALASKVSDHVVEMSSEKRRKLHLAAVFACNMVNHYYRLAEKVLEEEGIDFSLYLPLIQETANKVKELSPRKAQTGPMVRYDKNIMDAQISLINDERTRQIYRLMADSIHEDSTK